MSPPAKEMVVENENAMETRYNGVRNSVPVNREEVADVDDVAKKRTSEVLKRKLKKLDGQIVEDKGGKECKK